MTWTRDPRVDEYIEALPEWQQEICQQVRDLVHQVAPEVEETIKRTVQPYFVLEGNICALLASKNHVNIQIRAARTEFRRWDKALERASNKARIAAKETSHWQNQSYI